MKFKKKQMFWIIPSVIAVVIIILFATGTIKTGAVTGYCADSDDGNDPYHGGFVQGDVNGVDFEYPDACIDNTHLKEYLCCDSAVYCSRIIDCDDGCITSGDGLAKCASTPPTTGCTEPIANYGKFKCEEGIIFVCNDQASDETKWMLNPSANSCPINENTDTYDCKSEGAVFTDLSEACEKDIQCTADSQCNDNNLCTTDSCVPPNCKFTEKICPTGQRCEAGICVDLPPCNIDDDCNDKNPDTVDKCIDHNCQNTPLNPDWIVYSIVGGALLIGGGAVFYYAKKGKKRMGRRGIIPLVFWGIMVLGGLIIGALGTSIWYDAVNEGKYNGVDIVDKETQLDLWAGDYEKGQHSKANILKACEYWKNIWGSDPVLHVRDTDTALQFCMTCTELATYTEKVDIMTDGYYKSAQSCNCGGLSCPPDSTTPISETIKEIEEEQAKEEEKLEKCPPIMKVGDTPVIRDYWCELLLAFTAFMYPIKIAVSALAGLLAFLFSMYQLNRYFPKKDNRTANMVFAGLIGGILGFVVWNYFYIGLIALALFFIVGTILKQVLPK